MTTQSVDMMAAGRFPFVGKVRVIVMAGVAFSSFVSPMIAADIPDNPRGQMSALSGYYKVSSSSDPFFTMDGREWFMDFGSAGKSSGNVAVSMRQNPVVRVRRLVWQFYPQTSTLTLGAQKEEGSRQAVAVANWQVRSSDMGVVLERANYQIVLTRAQAGD